jgi:hypothetical protein
MVCRYPGRSGIGNDTSHRKELTLTFTDRRRGLRIPFVASITFTDVKSDHLILAQTSDLSVHGCFVRTPTPAKSETKLWIKIAYAGAKIAAIGKVAHVRGDGMGISFFEIEMRAQSTVDRWISRLW